MPSGVIRATPAELRRVAAGVGTRQRELSSQFEALNREVGGFSDSFQGRAATAFGTALERWFKAVGGTTLTLEALASYLSSTADTFEGVDSALAGGLAPVPGAGGGGGAGGHADERIGVVPPEPHPDRDRVAFPVPSPNPGPPGGRLPVDPPGTDPVDVEAIERHLDELRERSEQLERRLELVTRRLEWARRDLIALGGERTRLLVLREVLADGGRPEDLARIDGLLAENQAALADTGETIDRLSRRQARMGEAIDQVRADHDTLARSIGAPPLEPDLPPRPEFLRPFPLPFDPPSPSQPLPVVEWSPVPEHRFVDIARPLAGGQATTFDPTSQAGPPPQPAP